MVIWLYNIFKTKGGNTMKQFTINQRVRIVGAQNIMSRFGIIKEEVFPGAYLLKVACKHDRDRSLMFVYASEIDGSRLVLLGESYLQTI